MKLTKTKLNQLIRGALTENWQDEVAGGGPRPTRRVDPLAGPHQSRAGRAQQLKWAAEEEEGEDLFVTLSEEEKELADKMLHWWSQKLDEVPTRLVSKLMQSQGRAEEKGAPFFRSLAGPVR